MENTIKFKQKIKKKLKKKHKQKQKYLKSFNKPKYDKVYYDGIELLDSLFWDSYPAAWVGLEINFIENTKKSEKK